VPSRHGLDFLVNEDERESRKLEARLTNGAPVSKATRVDESRAVIAPDVRDYDKVGASQDTAIDISSAEEDSSSDESDEEEDRTPVAGKANGSAHALPMMNGHISDEDGASDKEEQAVLGAEDVEMADEEVEEDAELEVPSFGDLLQAQHPDPIDVQASLPNHQQALIPTNSEYALSAPSGATLRTVLTQALKTNDKDLLERCFQTTDLNDIRATIERLQSQHVATLLQILAERIHKRPGRTGALVTWIQWSLVAHGAYLASQPEVMKSLRSLAQVLHERASGLQPLLRLKGKLDMLSAQLELRQRMQAASRAANADEDEEDEAVVYVEGRDDDEWSDSEDEEPEAGVQAEARLLEGPIPKTKGQTATPRSNLDESSDESESEDDMPNGVSQEVEDESSEAEQEGGMFDVEAEETSDDNSAEEDSESADSEAESDDESSPSDNESEAAVRPAKPATLNRKR
jgi:U3 small nucleolar RNA-associated protein 5